MSSIWIRVGGVPATEIAPHSPPTWETLADGGCGSASFAFAMHARTQHHALRAGLLVEILCGPMAVWTGIMGDPDRTTWEVSAYGLSAALRERLALGPTGASTRNIGVAAAQAMARGWQGVNPRGYAEDVPGDEGAPISVGALFDEYAEQTGQRWGVNGAREIYVRADPTSPRWLATPGSAVFGASDEDVPTMLAGRYFNGTTYATATAGSGGREEVAELPEDVLTQAQAEEILGGMLLRTGDTAWTNGVELSAEQLTTFGGQPAFLPGVVAGQKVRAHGITATLAGPVPALDVVIGKTRYTAGEDSIYIEPVNTRPRTLRAVTAAA